MQRVELIKMRHRAVPGDPKDKLSPVLLDQRLHVKVKLDIEKYASREGIFWFRKVQALLSIMLDITLLRSITGCRYW